MNETYNDFIQKIMNVIDKVVLIRNDESMKTLGNGLLWKLAMKLDIAINDFKKFKKSKLRNDKAICNTARYELQKMIIDKKIAFFDNKLTESISKPNNQWTALRFLKLPSDTSPCEVKGILH